jgi:tRNA(fMet)-specific endonuclease VapC
MFLLDTDHVSLLDRADNAAGLRLRERLKAIPGEDWGTTIISYEEQVRGWLSYLARAKNLAQEIDAYRRLKKQLETYCQLIVLDFDDRAAAEFRRLRKAFPRLGLHDLQIAAIALAYDATLLSRNRKDFGRIPDLKLEDWTL